MTKSRSKAAYMISAVAEQYQIHPQTLRLYEREGLLTPSRSEGNTRLYTDEDLQRLEVILKLTRELGVNLAGVEIILNMREKMAAMQKQIEEFITTLNKELALHANARVYDSKHSLIPVIRLTPAKKVSSTGLPTVSPACAPPGFRNRFQACCVTSSSGLRRVEPSPNSPPIRSVPVDMNHMSTMRKSRSSSVCLFCGGDIGFWNRVRKQRFCSEDHESSYCERLTVIAVERLQQHRLTQAASPASPPLQIN